MGKNRLEAFSDGVIAIIITIMVLEMKIPHGDSLTTLAPIAPVFLSYILSFVYVGIYWNNHHHMLYACYASDRAHSVGESSSPFLAVTLSVRYRLDGRESLRRRALRALRWGTACGGRCILDSSTGHHCSPWAGLAAAGCDWPRLEGQDFTRGLSVRDCFYVPLAVGCASAIRGGSADVVGAGSQN